MGKLVSLIIPAKNEGDNLYKTIQAVKENTDYRSYEIIVVSRDYDREERIFRKIGVEIIESDMGSPSKSRNIGARFAKGEILVFLDAHVFPKNRNWLYEIVRVLKDKKIGLCGPCISSHENEKAKGYGMVPKNPLFELDWLPKLMDKPYEVPMLGGACVGIRKEVFKEIGGWAEFDSWGHEDSELSIRAWLMGYKVMIIPTIEVAHIFRKQHPYKVDYASVDTNLLQMALLHFSPHRIKRVLSSLEKARMPPVENAFTDHVVSERKRLVTKRKYEDDYFFNRFELKI